MVTIIPSKQTDVCHNFSMRTYYVEISLLNSNYPALSIKICCYTCRMSFYIFLGDVFTTVMSSLPPSAMEQCFQAATADRQSTTGCKENRWKIKQEMMVMVWSSYVMQALSLFSGCLGFYRVLGIWVMDQTRRKKQVI